MLKWPHRTRLPDGKQFYYFNRLELLYIYDEIITQREYVHDLIDYRDGSVVVDVGANIGLFMYFISKMCEGGQIYCIEPIPDLLDVLRRNAESIDGHEVSLFNCGLSSETTSAVFHFLPHCTVASTMDTNSSFLDMSQTGRTRQKKFTLELLRHMPHPATARALSMLPSVVRSWLTELLMHLHAKSKLVTCELKTVSQFIDENKIQGIDILKVDAEGSEAEILMGIEDRHWPRIRQLMVEVHQEQGTLLDQIISIVDSHGYQRAIEYNPYYPFPMVFASRCPGPGVP